MKFVTSLILLFLLTHQTFASNKTLDIAAAASLKESITEIAARFETSEGVKLNLTFNASGTLAKQIEQGAPADVFISAANEQIEQLDRAQLVLEDSRTIIAGNELVLIAPPNSKIDSFDDLKSADIKHIAIGQPDSVPAGQYAVQTFKSLGIFELIESKFLYGTNVRQVLEYIVRGDVDAGIVYSSDAKSAGDSVTVCATAAWDLHDPIVYISVIIKTSDTPDLSKKFIEMLKDDESKSVFKSRGFTNATEPAEAPAN